MSNTSIRFVSRRTSSERQQDVGDPKPTPRRLQNLLLADALLTAEPALFDGGELKSVTSLVLAATEGTS